MEYADMLPTERWTWASALAHSTYIPKSLQGQPGNVFFAAELALAFGQDPLSEILGWNHDQMVELLVERYGADNNADAESEGDVEGVEGEQAPAALTAQPATPHQTKTKPGDFPPAAAMPPGTLHEARTQFTTMATARNLTTNQLAEVISWATTGRSMDLEDMTIDELAHVISRWNETQ
ncbi:hypothetical protein [Trueperella bernardiae]|uniref:hypothetical protein n=1 Tax=Trueperella bernardiae TaxID=59561 RepID=UPI00288A3CD5|nr:hypothetical protein [Trueperella bernardiae]